MTASSFVTKIFYEEFYININDLYTDLARDSQDWSGVQENV